MDKEKKTEEYKVNSEDLMEKQDKQYRKDKKSIATIRSFMLSL